MKLFFARRVDTATVVALAQANAVEHARRLTVYERILPELEGEPDAAFALATLRLGLRHEQIAVEFWQGIAANPPRVR